MSEQPEQTGQLTEEQKDQAAREQGTQRTPLTGEQPSGDAALDPDNQADQTGEQSQLSEDEQAALDQKHRDNMDPTKQADVPRTPAGVNEGVGMNAGEGKPGDPVDTVQHTAPMNPDNPGQQQLGQSQVREGLYQHPEHAGQLTMRDTGDASQYEVTRKIRLADEEAKARREGREPNPAAANAVRTSEGQSDEQADDNSRLSVLDRDRDNLSDDDGLNTTNSNDASVKAEELENKDQQ